ncbi:MAG TPA: DUF4169 family protein [Rhizomicrobium sp.]|nr:DUF4169 family protein [Rhizomicrobium sp.]
MTNIVNLKSVRKAKARREKEVVAEANRAKHGVSKSAHRRAKLLQRQGVQNLEGHRLDEAE